MKKIAFKQRWMDFWTGLGALHPAAEEVFHDFTRRYGEKHRAYHTIPHIIHCLGQLDLVKHIAANPAALEAGFDGHDVVYDPARHDNELKSAELTAEAIRFMGLPQNFVQVIFELIMATDHKTPPTDPDAKLMVDIDLSGFGQPYKKFQRDSMRVWQEYRSLYAVKDFNAGRAKILEGFRRREPLYQTEFFRARYEVRARENLARAIQELRCMTNVQ